jgi:hypothetical protein
MESVWIFNKNNAAFSGGVFSELNLAESWIKENSLTGILTKYPLDQGVFDWAIKNDMHNIKAEKVAEKSKQPNFVGGFTSASQEHYHYENGIRA